MGMMCGGMTPEMMTESNIMAEMRRFFIIVLIAALGCLSFSVASAQGFRLYMSKSIMEIPNYKKAAAIDQITDWTEVTGSIQASQRGAAGLIGSTSNSSSDLNISKCWSSVEINSTIEGFGSLGGFIGTHSGEVKVKITNCLFDGKILGEKTYGGGGFIGRVYSDDSKRAVTFTSSLMNAADIGFLTDIYQNSYASGPFYGFVKSPASDKYYYSCVAFEGGGGSGFTKRFGSIVEMPTGPSSQGYDWTQESVAQIVSWLNYDSDNKCWQVVDGKPVLKF